MPTFKEMTDYFQEVGATDVAHTSKSYLAHGISVSNDLKAWGAAEDVQSAGLFHSIYGTELFQGFTLPLERRDEVKQLIGERAERLAWLNCVMDRRHFDQEILKPEGPYQISNRFDQELVPVSDEDFRDLSVIHLCDWLEQVERSGSWDYRRSGYKTLAERLGGIGKQRYDEVFASAPEQVWFDEYEDPKTRRHSPA
jgi:hypothetical protein